MGITVTYSRLKDGLPDIFTYDDISTKLKIQIFHIWKEFFLQEAIPKHIQNQTFEEIISTILKEHGILYLPKDDSFRDGPSRLYSYINQLSGIDKVLDVIQLMFQFSEFVSPFLKDQGYNDELKYKAEEAIEELNYRFKENGVGYEFKSSRILRTDHSLLHKEAIQVALHFLLDSKYATVNNEYLTAHSRFRLNTNEGNQECLVWCLKAFESTIKIICKLNRWEFEEKFTAQKLINLLFTKGFFARTHESALVGIKQFLESSIPTLRNKYGGHGAGEENHLVPTSMAQYMLYITGSTIRLLIDTQNEKSQ
ncbi:MAG TPA: hypothetical protein VGN00_20265 [Puia sp.]